MIVIDIPLQPLRVPAGWAVISNKFHDLEPVGEIKVKGFVNDDGWALFEDDLLVVKHEKQNIFLEIGWLPQYEPDGRFVLRLVKDEDWMNSHHLARTREKAEIVEAINEAMLRFSRESGDYTLEGEGLALQPLCITRDWRVVHNQFFDLAPQPDLKVQGLPKEDGWALFSAHILQLETSFDAEYKVDLSWEPAHDPAGRYVVRLVRHDDWGKPLKQKETRDKDEVVKVIEQFCVD